MLSHVLDKVGHDTLRSDMSWSLQTGAERILGSVAGGTLGYVVYEVGHRLWDPDTRTDGVRACLTRLCSMLASILPSFQGAD